MDEDVIFMADATLLTWLPILFPPMSATMPLPLTNCHC
jgi:hypothetical protein